ncbi:MAG TPA: hypothetical protein VF990_11735, partial [Candidatus Dormibacteraeota bacterium]
MTLRAEIHDAVDEVTPPAPHLEFQVKKLLLDGERQMKAGVRSGGRALSINRFRGVVTLVAAALVVVLIGGLILGGRLLRDMNAPAHPINQTELTRLEARPVQFPVVRAGATCPISPVTDTSAHSLAWPVFGIGPVYVTPLEGISARTDWGAWTVLSLLVDTTNASKLILIRGTDLETNAMVVFTRTPLHAADDPGDGIATGRVIGSQVVEGERQQLYSELVIDTSRAYAGTP